MKSLLLLIALLPVLAFASTYPDPKGVSNTASAVYTWSEVDGATGYHAALGMPSSNKQAAIRDAGNSDTFTYDDLLPGMYEARVRAYNASGESEWTPIFEFAVLPTQTLNAPESLGVSVKRAIIIELP